MFLFFKHALEKYIRIYKFYFNSFWFKIFELIKKYFKIKDILMRFL
jgi:hypothetical protein